MNKKITQSFIDNIKTDQNMLESLSGYGKLIYSSEIRDFLHKFISEHIDKFKMFENKYLYNGEDEIITIIIPIVRKVYNKVFISPPPYFKEDMLELYKLNFDINDLCDYLIKMLNTNERILLQFDYLDKTIEYSNLIADNYLGLLYNKTTKSINIKSDIRDIKLKRLI
jgi:hypothetical protein